MHKKIAAYIRVSTQEQADFGFGLDVQKEKIEQYIKLFDINMQQVNWYIDEGKSAKNLNRPQMKQLLQEINESRIEKVIIYKLDRLSRSVIDTYDLIKTLTDKNCSLVSVIDQIDISSANGRMFVGMLAIIAQWERETISERTSDALREMAFQGMYPFGKPPYGYSKDENKILYINEDEANVIKHLVEDLKRTESLKKTIDNMNEGMVGGRVWKYQTISKMINNPFYRGDLVTPKYTIKNHHIALFTEQEYTSIKLCLNRTKVDTPKMKYTYLFHDKIYCATCDTKCKQLGTTKSNGIRYNYYRCDKCGISVNEETIMAEVKFSLLSDFRSINNDKIVDNYRIKLSDLSLKKEEILRGYISNKHDLSFYETTYSRLKSEESKINKEINKALEEALQEYKDLSMKEKALYFMRLYDKIHVDLKFKRVISTVKSN